MRRFFFLLISLLGVLVLSDCAQKPVAVPVRSLERSGRLALVCLDPQGGPTPAYPLDGCGQEATHDPLGFPPRVFALVTQATRGEVAVLDVTFDVVVDTDATTPGYNFLPVGAQPTDIVASPGSIAAFVGSAEVNHPGLYALPTNRILSGGPTIRAWPACSLPAAPGPMAYVLATDTGTRCDSPAVPDDSIPEKDRPNGHPNGDLTLDAAGRGKLIVALPSTGDIAIIDAQALLDREAGSFDECPIDRLVKLDVNLPPNPVLTGLPVAQECPPGPMSIAAAPGCPVRAPETVQYPTTFTSQPSSFSIENGPSQPPSTAPRRLFVSDAGAPVIHVLDVHDACNPEELDPFLPSSFDQPSRPVTTTKATLSPITSDLKQFLYAVDQDQGSLMVFDVSPTSPSRSPIVRPRADLFPFWSRDRVALLSAPVKDVLFVTQELPADNGIGTYQPGVLCDPTEAYNQVPGGVFQPAPDYSVGAGPHKLRGTFAMVALTNGAIVFVDVDDYDAPCRRYLLPADGSTLLPSSLTGCGDECTTDVHMLKQVTGEASCRVVDWHEVRSYYYISSNNDTGQHANTFQTFPNLSFQGNTLPADTSDQGLLYPKLRGPAPQGGGPWALAKLGAVVSVEPDPLAADSTQHFILPDDTEPRLAIEQDWTISYEGALPGFDGKTGQIHARDLTPNVCPKLQRPDGSYPPIDNGVSHDGADPCDPSGKTPDPNYVSPNRGFFDANAGFCYAGAHDEAATIAEAIRLGLLSSRDPQALTDWARGHSDYLEVTSDLLGEDDPYWMTDGLSCSFISCRATFGTQAAPTVNRSFRITQAYDDRVLTAYEPIVDVTRSAPDGSGPEIDTSCCFPTLVTYRLRGHQTWIAAGSTTGFTHHVAPIGPNGECADLGMNQNDEECDATFRTRTSREYEVPAGTTSAVSFDSPYVFHNGQFFSVIYPGSQPTQRDMGFSWHETGGFVPLSVGVGRGSSLVSPQAMFYHPSLGTSVLVTDGAQQGVVEVDLLQIAVTNVFF